MFEHRDSEGIQSRGKKKSPLVLRIVLYLMLITLSCFVVYGFFIRFSSQNEVMNNRRTKESVLSKLDIVAKRDGRDKKEEYRVLGKKVFAERCVPCHGADARGLIGPDLTRKDFTYGKTEAALNKTISMGRPGGMPAFGDNLSREQIKSLVQFVLSL